MSEYEYLKKVCEKEESIYEMTKKVEKGKREYARVNQKVDGDIKSMNKDLETKLQEIKDLGKKKQSLRLRKETTMSSQIVYVVSFLLALLLFQSFVYFISVIKYPSNLVEVNALGFTLAIGILSFIVSVCIIIFSLGDLDSGAWNLALQIFTTPIAVAYILALIYYTLCINVFSMSVKSATILFTVLAGIAIVIATFCYFYNNNIAICSENEKAEKELETLTNLEKKLNREYNSLRNSYDNKKISLRKSLAQINFDIERNENILSTYKKDLKALYAMNIIHEGYQKWECAELFYIILI